jgi:DNA repair exonuclease SbcCD ATPase subunit
MTEVDAGNTAQRASMNGRQKGAENAEILRAYLKELRGSGNRLPARNGTLDKSAIAFACGFNRQTLYNNPEAIALLEQALNEIGIEVSTAASDMPIGGKVEHLQKQMDKRDKRIRQLEEMLAARTAELTAMKREVKEVKDQLRQYTAIEEVMTMNGRKFRP